MDSNKIFTILAICILGAGAYMLVYNNHQQPQSPYQTAKLVTSSIFEMYPYSQPIEMYRLIYQYDRGSIPSSATYFYVNITIPQDIVQKLDQYAQKYPNDDSLFPVVYTVQNDLNTLKFINYRSAYDIHVISTDSYGIPTKIQAVFRTADVPSSDNYIIVAFPAPFASFFQKLKTLHNPLAGTDAGNGWIVVVSGGQSIDIAPIYFNNFYSSDKGIYLTANSGSAAVESYILLSKNIDINVDPNKPLYVYNLAKLQTDWGPETRWAVLVGMEFINQTGNTYKVLLVRGNYNPLNTYIKSRFDCIVYAQEPYYDAASYIRRTCSDYDWNKVVKIDKIYVGGDLKTWDNTHATLYILGIGVANNKYIQLLTS